MTQAQLKPERFDTTVENYVAARTRYAPKLIAWLAEETQAEGRFVVDLGCGPGFIAHEIAPHVGRVLGLDPSPNMIAAAQDILAENRTPNVAFAIGSSEDFSAIDAPVQLVTIGRAFHWVNREQTLADLDGIISPGGAIAIINDSTIKVPRNAWWHAFNGMIKEMAVLDDYNQNRASDAWVPHEEVLAASGFGALRRISVFETHEWTFDTLYRHALSRSGTTAAMLGPRVGELEGAHQRRLGPLRPRPMGEL